MTQTWHNLLFAHWPVDPAVLRPLVPRQFALDLFENRAWLAIVPFQMTNVAPRGVPSLPWISEFAELNVRTYVRVDDKPGIYFFSLDAASALAVRAARRLLNLPYFAATMRVSLEGDSVAYDSRREGGAMASFSARYWPCGKPFEAINGTLEYFLTERYCLYNLDHQGTPYRLEIHHPPWRLQPAEANVAADTMAEASGLSRPGISPLLHFSRRQDMVAWPPSAL